ncbi:hypothetical protein [Rhizobium mesoamericanum]|nr:hypothetical protein [Rhizobium mesoamericanum]
MALLLSSSATSAHIAVESTQFDRLGSGTANSAILADEAKCRDRNYCDPRPCTVPVRLREPLTEALSNNQGHQFEAFRLCEQFTQLATHADQTMIWPSSENNAEATSFAEASSRWNGDFQWKPASASTDIITRFGDEARAVFGPIPDIDCGDLAAKVIPLEIDGNIVDLKPNPAISGSPLQFEHRDAKGKIVKWSTQIAKCDKPSLAGNVTYCGMNSRVSRRVVGTVEWVSLCRKSSPHLEIDPEPYWQKNNPTFARLGIIGFNRESGEIVFFDGSKNRQHFDWTTPFTPPGGRSYADHKGRTTAATLYDSTFQIQCSACHDNKAPYVISPHIGQARIGYFGGAASERALAFSLGDYVPKMKRDERLPFRVIGSAYTATYATDLARARTVEDPSGNCTQCHTLTTQITGQRIAADAAGRIPEVTNPTWAQVVSVRAEVLKLSEIDAHRTDWARRSAYGNIHPWMVPREGNKITAESGQMSEDDWRQLSNCIWEAGGKECRYKPLFTACPAPGVQLGGDGSQPTAVSSEVLPVPTGEVGANRVLRLRWSYLNDYGHVPQRDDVRFNIAIKSTPIPLSGKAPLESDYPTIDEAKDAIDDTTVGHGGTSGRAMFVGDLSYFGHKRFTDPAPSTTPREFRADLPAMCNRRYLARVLAKRFCFDQSGVKYADRGQVLFADVTCN